MDPSAPAPTSARLATRAITAFLFLTGASALVYQVVWTRYLGLLLGSSSVAVVVVLAAFMGGLALGSWRFGKLADRPIRRLTLYAWLELGVGVYCVLFPSILSLATGPYLALVGSLSTSHPTAFTVARLTFAAALLLPPTILMGGTLPAAIRFLVGLAPGVRSAVGRLYWVNSAGAVLGALLAGFVLIPGLGLDLSLDLAAFINVGVAAAALLLRQRVGEVTGVEPAADPAEVRLSGRAVGAALAAVTLSGFAALAVEVAWTRLMALVLGGSTYAFTVMVATFILGIALGSRLVTAARFGRGDPLVWLGGALTLVAALLAISIPLYPRLSWLFQGLRSLLSSSPSAFPLYQVMLFVTAGLVMLLPTIAMGATLPLAARIAASGGRIGTRVGLTWALNTAGTLLGAVLTGLVLLPRLGLRATFALVAACYAVAALVALLGASPDSRRGRRGVALAGLVTLVLLALAPPWPLEAIHAGAFRQRTPPGSYAEWSANVGRDLLWARDGATSSVAVMARGGDRLLRVNGKTDASLRGDLDTQLLLGHVPALLAREGASRALVIGVGSGATVAALAAHPALLITAVEIEPAVLEAARRWFGEVNEGVLENHPRVQVLVEDAKTVFQRGGPAWDLIVSEPSNPWLAGVGGLFTTEFFEAARARLAPGGVMAQWLQSYDLDDASVRLVLRTYLSVFKEVTVWQSQSGDYILLGSAEPLTLDPPLLARRFTEPAVRRSLERVSVDSVAGLLARQALSPAGVQAAAGTGDLNSDQFPSLEFEAPRGLFMGEASRMILDVDERAQAFGLGGLLVNRWLGGPPGAELLQSMARSVARSHFVVAEALLRRAAAMTPPRPEPAVALATTLEARGDFLRSRELLGSAPRSPAGDRLLAQVEFNAAVQSCQALRNGIAGPPDCSPAIRLGEALRKEAGRSAGSLPVDERLAAVYVWSGANREALQLYREMLARSGPLDLARQVDWRTGEAVALLGLGDRAGARAAAGQVVRLEPSSWMAARILATAER